MLISANNHTNDLFLDKKILLLFYLCYKVLFYDYVNESFKTSWNFLHLAQYSNFDCLSFVPPKSYFSFLLETKKPFFFFF